MILRNAALAALLLSGLAIAQDDDASRAKLMGSWQTADAGKDAVTWTIQEKGDTIHIANASGGKVLMEFDCDSFGHDCAIKDAGRAAKISQWYQGPKLIQMETRGSYIWKRTFGVAADGSLEVEVAQISPMTKSETIHFKRQETAAAKQ